MIIEGQESVTKAVLSELARADNPRFKEVMSALVKHLHAFIREVKLTEEEFQKACGTINAIGQSTKAYHNEAVLMSGSLGVSTLVCLLNNGNNGQTETTANLLGAHGSNNLRPAHLHFLIIKEGFKTHVSQVYVPEDPHIDTDVHFGVTKALLGNYVRHESGTPPAPGMKTTWYTLDTTFTM